MKQKEFTEYVINKLVQVLPEFNKFCVQQTDDVMNIEYMSKHNNLKLWVTTYNLEITIGFESKPKLNDWHTHFTPYEFELIDEYIQDAVNIISDIIQDRPQITYSNISGFTLFSPSEEIKLKPNETIEIKRWSEW